MKKKLFILLLIVPFICLVYVSHTATKRDYIKIQTSVKNIPEIYSNTSVNLVTENNKNVSNIDISKYLDNIYIFGVKPGNYNLKLSYNNQVKTVFFSKSEDSLVLKPIIFDSTLFDYYKFNLSFGVLIVIAIFIYFISQIIKKRKNRFLKVANNAFIILVGFRFLLFLFKVFNLDLKFYENIYTVSIYAEHIVGFSLLLYVIESLDFKYKKTVKNITYLFLVYSLLSSTLILFGDIPNILGYFGSSRNILVVVPLYLLFFSSGDYILTIIPATLLGNQIYKFYKIRSKIYFKQELPLFLLILLSFIFQWKVLNFTSESSNGSLLNILNIYTFLFSLILVLFKSYLYSDNDEYKLINQYFWILFKLTFYLFGSYLFLVYSKNFTLSFFGTLGILIIDISYTIFKNSIDKQFFSLNYILYRENEASTLTQFKDLIKKEIQNKIFLKEVDLDINFNGILHPNYEQNKDNIIYFSGILEEKTIVLLKVTPIYELKVFEKKALEELVNEIPKVSLKINNREESFKKNNLDSYILGTKLLELKELVILNNNNNLEDNPIKKAILNELDSIIKEVDQNE